MCVSPILKRSIDFSNTYKHSLWKWCQARLSKYLLDLIFSNHSTATAKRFNAINLPIPLSHCYPDGNRYTNTPHPPQTLALTMTKTHHTNCYPKTSGTGEVQSSQVNDFHNTKSKFFRIVCTSVSYRHFLRSWQTEPSWPLLALLLAYRMELR
jgi:hypothetical protein